jgi:hypothetical protein
LTDYLEVNFGGTFVGGTFISPVLTNPMSGGLNTFQVLLLSSDIVDPIAGGNADSAFTYGDGTPAGVTIDNPVSGSKIVFLGFGLENIPLSARQVLMPAALVWFEILTSVQSTPDDVPGALLLEQNYPNPFNPSTTIRYELSEQGLVALKVYNLLGQEVATLVDEEQEAGSYQVQFDGTSLASGVYLYRLRAGGFVETKKLILLR